MSSPDLSPAPVIVWFRDDLRVADHPALTAAAETGRPVVPVFVLDEESPGVRARGGAAKWWLAGSLRSLSDKLARVGSPLVLRRGAAVSVLRRLIEETKAAEIVWNRRYVAAEHAVDEAVAATARDLGVGTHTFQAALLAEPDAVRTKAGTPFGVFTPFLKAVLARPAPRAPLPAPKRLRPFGPLASDRLEDWGLEPTRPDWAEGLRETWTTGEDAARTTLTDFVESRLAGYAENRDRPDLDGTSRVSPRLRHGEVSPFQVFHCAMHAREAGHATPKDVDKFVAELVWREFAYHLLHHRPDLAERNYQARFDAFPFGRDADALKAWRRGRTGYPIVDAAMRQLWRIGWMHNRARMIVASLLTKHLLIDWREGERWFWDTLVDADPANNAASWQWVAGSGADAAPYFRIFNPMLQGAKFDPDGAYVKHWVPELARLRPRDVHAPFEAPEMELAAAGVRLGETYPRPIVSHEAARARALAAFARLGERTG